MLTHTLNEAETFFYENAGYSWEHAAGETEEHGHTRCAIILADAERSLKASGAYVEWTPEAFTPGEYVATLFSEEGELLGNLGGVELTGSDDPQRRVVAAELASVYL